MVYEFSMSNSFVFSMCMKLGKPSPLSNFGIFSSPQNEIPYLTISWHLRGLLIIVLGYLVGDDSFFS